MAEPDVTPEAAITCPFCGSEDLERRGDHWCCVACLRYWLAFNAKDRRLLKAMKIAPEC